MAQKFTNKSTETTTDISEAKTMQKIGKTLKAIVTSRIFFVVIILLLAALPSVYFYNHGQARKIVGDLQTVDQVVEQVNKLYILPTGESPTMATVTDVNVAKSQPFLANAVNGDKVLIYPKARIAILYRPSADKLVGVTHLTVSPTQ